MNDAKTEMILPRPPANWLHQQARAARRAWVRHCRDIARGPERRRYNIELNWREFWHGRTRLRSTPRLIQVGTNWSCNLKCNFCRLTMDWTQEQLRKLSPPEREISDRVFQVVKELLAGAEMMVLTPLGEPFLWSRLDELLEHHARLGTRNLAMTTNGMLLNDRNCERIVRGQLAHLFCSIDSNDPEVYANMRVGGELRRVEDGLRRLAQWKQRLGTEFPKMTCNATFLERNIRQLPSMVAWAKDLGFQELSVQLMEIENPELEEEFLGHHAQLVHDSVLEALAVGRRIGMSVRPHLAIRNLVTAARAGRDVRHHEYAAAAPNMPADRKRRAAIDGKGSHGGGDGGCQDCPLAVDEEARQLEELLDMSGKTLVEKCHYPWYNLLIDTDGDARPCCWADLSFGNLNDVPFDQVWNGPRAVGMRQAFLANRVPHSCRRKHCRVDL